jgi:hypothetical protein
MRFNIIPIEEMIDLIDDFFKDGYKQVLKIGEMVGCDIFHHVTDYAIEYATFNQTLFIEGCQDYVSLSSNKLPNYVFYPTLLEERNPDPIIPRNPFKGKWFNPPKEYQTVLNMDHLIKYKLMIINNAHLIDPVLITELTHRFGGKIVIIADPFDIDGDIYSPYPCVTDTFIKLPTIYAMARNIYGEETRFIDKHKSSVTEVKMQQRSIGRIDDKQYISNDPDVIQLVREKQYSSGFRKNQKLIVTPKYKRKKYDGFPCDLGVVVYNNTMMTITSTQQKIWMACRIYNSKDMIKCVCTYDLDDTDTFKIHVSPANILSIDQMHHHRFKNMVFYYNTDIPLTRAERYSIVKNSNNLQVVIK